MKKRNDLTAGFVRSVLNYDPATGIFTWRWRADVRKPWNCKFSGKPAGCIATNGYFQICINAKLYGGHRLAWLHVTGEWPVDEIDHRNGDRSDNRFDNLREATGSQNMHNKKRHKNNTSGFPGVRLRPDRGTWEACIYRNGKRVWRHHFPNAEEAVTARRLAIRELHGEFASRDA